MVDAPEPPAGEATDRPDADATPRSPARLLDRRTVAICACIAIVAALAAGLIASMVLGDDSTDGMTLSDPVDSAKLMAAPATTSEGEPSTLGAHLDGKPMLINFWQSSCTPCVREMPLLEAAHVDNPDVTFVGVSTEDRDDKADAMAEQTGITYPWLRDPTGEVYYLAGAPGMPSTLLVSAEGKVIASESGDFTSSKELQSFIDEHLG